MTIGTLPFEHRPRNSIANNLDKINELVDWANLDTHLYASASGERVTVDDASSVKGLMVEGRSIQDGTPTPDAPVPVQVVEGPLSLVIGDASVAINMQGNTLASLPDGKQDELHVDSTGRVWIVKRVGAVTFDGDESWSKATSAPYNMYIRSTSAGSGFSDIEIAESQYNPKNIAPLCNRFEYKGRYSAYKDQYGLTISGTSAATDFCIDWRNISESLSVDEWKTWLAEHPVTVYYPLATPQTINLSYITPPEIPSGSVVTVSASLTPMFTLEWWIDDGITTLVNDLIAYIDYKTEG